MRRSISILAIAVLTVTAGCLGGLGGGGDQQLQGPPPIDHVPDDVHAVASYDSAVVSDPATRSVMNTLLEESVPADSGEPRSVDALVAEFQNETSAETNLSLSSVSGVTSFSKFPSMGSLMMGGQPDVYAGVLVRTGWTESEVTDELEGEVTETEYGGTTIYTEPGVTPEVGTETTVAFAKYGENDWVFGTREVVEDVIDLSNGDGEALSGQLRDVYESTRSDAYVRMAVEVPREYRTAMSRLMEQGMAPGGQVGSQLPVQNVTHLSSAYYSDGGQDGSVGVSLNVRFDSADLADSVTDQAEGAISFAEGQVENETLEAQIEAIDVSRDGQTLSMTYESAVSDLQDLIRQFGDEAGNPLGGATGMSSGPDAPQVAFEYRWDGANGRLTAVHEGGDTLRGENLQAVCGGTVVETSSGEVSAGTTVVDTTECAAGDTVRIVWRSPDGGTSQVISTYDVPGSARLVAPAAA